MLDPDDYVAKVKVQLTNLSWIDITAWAIQNNVSTRFAYGNVYFKSEEDAVAFKLKFGEYNGTST